MSESVRLCSNNGRATNAWTLHGGASVVGCGKDCPDGSRGRGLSDQHLFVALAQEVERDGRRRVFGINRWASRPSPCARRGHARSGTERSLDQAEKVIEPNGAWRSLLLDQLMTGLAPVYRYQCTRCSIATP